MERLIRFLLSLFLSGLIGAAGLTLIVYALLTFQKNFLVLAFLDGEVGATTAFQKQIATSLREALSDPALFFQPPVITLWTIVPGLLLTGFGIFQIVRRLVGGVPQSELRPSQTPEARWSSVAIYVFALLLLMPPVISGLIKAPKTAPLVFLGTETSATVSSIRFSGERTYNNHKIYLADATFTDANGRERSAVVDIPYFKVQSLNDAPVTELVYLEGNPPVADLKRSVPKTAPYIWFFTWRFALIYVAICGLLRNLPPRHPGPLQAEAEEPSTLADPPSNPVSNRSAYRSHPAGTGGKQRGFGRRGVS